MGNHIGAWYLTYKQVLVYTRNIGSYAYIMEVGSIHKNIGSYAYIMEVGSIHKNIGSYAYVMEVGLPNLPTSTNHV